MVGLVEFAEFVGVGEGGKEEEGKRLKKKRRTMEVKKRRLC